MIGGGKGGNSRLTLATKAASASRRRIPAVGRGLQLWLPICGMAPLVALIAARVPSLVAACVALNSSQLTLDLTQPCWQVQKVTALQLWTMHIACGLSLTA